MAFIKEEKTFSGMIVRYYKLDNIITEIDAVRWLSQIRDLDGFVASHIDFDDLLSSDDGSERICFKGDVSLDELENNIKKRSIVTICMAGYYKEERVVIGFDFYNHDNPYEIYISKRIGSNADIDDLAAKLKLI